MEENKLMIISRCLSPPTENPTDVIYVGEWLDLKEIPKVVDKGPKEARKYFYGISRIQVKDNHLIIYNKTAVYNEILNPGCMGTYGSSITLKLDDSVKKGLVRLLQSKD